MIKTISMDEFRGYQEGVNYRTGRKPGFSSQDVLEFLHSKGQVCEVVLPSNVPFETIKVAYQNSIKRYGNNQIHLRNYGDKIFMVKDGKAKKQRRKKPDQSQEPRITM